MKDRKMKTASEWYMFFSVLLLVTIKIKFIEGACPLSCICKWKSGKQTVECKDRGLITIPEGVDPETQVLDVSNNNLQNLPRKTFSRVGLINLQKIFLQNCHIGKIDDIAFKGLTNLIELDLSHNLLTAVPSKAFQDIPFLRDLVLANNPIQKIDSHAFKALPSLVKLDLSNCELQTIAPYAFEGVELLETLKLNGNRLSELRPRTVEILRNLHSIELHDNPWHCDCRLRPVKAWLVENNIPLPSTPVCSGGPERVIQSTFIDLHVDDFACKPEILPVNRHVEVNASENATVICKASAIPPPHINWYWNGRLVVNNSKFTQTQKIYIFEEGDFNRKSTLVLASPQELNFLEFYCTAENRAGSAEANFTILTIFHPASVVMLGNGHIAGLSAALITLILFVLFVVLTLLARVRRQHFSESKIPNNIEAATIVSCSNSSSKATVSSAKNLQKVPSDLNMSASILKPAPLNVANNRVNNESSSFTDTETSIPKPGKKPDLINDTKLKENKMLSGIFTSNDMLYETDEVGELGSGEYYSKNSESLYPSGFWTNTNMTSSDFVGKPNLGFTPEDKLCPTEEVIAPNYPPDYGLPIPDADASTSATTESNSNVHVNPKTLRVWQTGGVPVLPPVAAIKKTLNHNTFSDEGNYGTDV